MIKIKNNPAPRSHERGYHLTTQLFTLPLLTVLRRELLIQLPKGLIGHHSGGAGEV